MKTPEEIKKGLKYHSEYLPCAECPYETPTNTGECIKYLTDDALALIQQLEEQIDLMKIQMQGDCGVCKHWNGEKCDECLAKTGHPHWEYEGLPK